MFEFDSNQNEITMLGLSPNDDHLDFMMGIDLDTDMMDNEVTMLGGFKDSMKRFGKWIKRTGKKVLNILPSTIDLITKNKDKLIPLINMIPNNTVKDALNTTIKHIDKTKPALEFINKHMQDADKKLSKTEKDITASNLTSEVKGEIQKNIGMIRSNLGGINKLSPEMLKKFKTQIKYLPLLKTNRIGGVTGKTKDSIIDDINALKALGVKYKTKKVDSEIGRMFLGGKSGAVFLPRGQSVTSQNMGSLGGLKPEFMVSRITDDKKKKGKVGDDFDSFFK